MRRLLLLTACAAASVVRFDGHSVLHVELETEAQLRRVEAFGWDVWSRDSVLALGTNDILVPPGAAEQLRALNISSSVMIADVQAAVEATNRRAAKTSNTTTTTGADPWFKEYHDYPDLIQWYVDAANKYPALAKYQEVGATTDGRAIGMFTLDAKPRAGKKTAYIQAGIHAREWISPATTNFIVNELLQGYANQDQEITALLDAVTLHVIPSVNPDGYAFTFSSNRMWRKNRRPNGGSSFGVDLNRNYGSHWGCCGGSSPDPNSETYRGPSAFSEPESNALSRVFHALKPDGGIDMHSYSQFILRQWAWTRTDCADEEDLRALGETMKQSIARPYGTPYTNQRFVDMYVGDGVAADWFYDPVEGAGAKWSYTVELRDTGRYGFLLPPDQIVPTGEETFLGIKDWLRAIANS